jgi:hypothetical protein
VRPRPGAPRARAQSHRAQRPPPRRTGWRTLWALPRITRKRAWACARGRPPRPLEAPSKSALTTASVGTRPWDDTGAGGMSSQPARTPCSLSGNYICNVHTCNRLIQNYQSTAIILGYSVEFAGSACHRNINTSKLCTVWESGLNTNVLAACA